MQLLFQDSNFHYETEKFHNTEFDVILVGAARYSKDIIPNPNAKIL